MKLGLALSLAVALSPSARADQKAIDKLLARCEKKTVVMGFNDSGKVVEAGERIDGYCEGYLDAAFASLLRAKAICLKEGAEPPTSDFLLSMLRKYRPEAKGDDPIAIVEAAFRRSYACGRPQ